jgi:hypothetical protein
MKDTGKGASTRKIYVSQGSEQLVWVVHSPKLVEHVLGYARKNILDLASFGKVLLVIDSVKLP